MSELPEVSWREMTPDEAKIEAVVSAALRPAEIEAAIRCVDELCRLYPDWDLAIDWEATKRRLEKRDRMIFEAIKAANLYDRPPVP